MQEKLDFFIEKKRIPNIIFHGPSGSGKKKFLLDFINKIYNYNKDFIEQYVMYINCAFGKGIKFIRDELKHFAKTNTHGHFKSVVLFNAEKLTVDAQSALRRCIEITNTMYELSYSALDLETHVSLEKDTKHKYQWLMYYSKIRSEFRNEMLLLYVLLHLYVFRTEMIVKLFM